MEFPICKLFQKNLKKTKVSAFALKILKNIRKKNSGISLLMALGISSLVLGISYATVQLVTKSIERNAAIERSNQVFYTAESGIEAAFFHHNARGAGIHFVADDEDTQTIAHSETISEVYWKIDGRSNPFLGTVSENQTIQIPLFWDDSLNPSDTPNTDGELGIGENFILDFQDTNIPAEFNFGSNDNEILIDWSLLRKDSSDELQTFVPTDTSCADGFICDDNIFKTSINSANATAGKIYPGLSTTTLNNFFTESGAENFQLKFQPLLEFQDSNSLEKIEYIPFALTTSSATIPKSAYTISADVLIGDYSRTIEIIVPEKTAIGAFSYVIFD